ncbi:MAG TPA: hypothetical protein PLN24_09365 [Victivallales bacterium]|nr:hypothetical protein [Victivallales bacterium]HPO90001.1 hypothetical protein [Victivallales bacterium]HRU01600.1 hypothetical protein [Victivallales bacterium]
MKKVYIEHKVIYFLLFSLFIYFFTYFLFASGETLFFRIKSGDISDKKLETVNLLSDVILSEMPLENREKLDDLPSQDFIFISSYESKLLPHNSTEKDVLIRRFTPLSILLF